MNLILTSDRICKDSIPCMWEDGIQAISCNGMRRDPEGVFAVDNTVVVVVVVPAFASLASQQKE